MNKKTKKQRYIKCLTIIFLLLLTQIVTTTLAKANYDREKIITSGQYGKGVRFNIQGWVYIHIEGDPYDRGYQYGYLASAEIVDMINRWSNWVHADNPIKIFDLNKNPDNYYEKSKTLWDICKMRAFNRFWRHFPDEYQQEIQGIADGVKAQAGMVHGNFVDFKDILTLNVIEETRRSFATTFKRTRPIRNLIKEIKEKLSTKPEDESEHKGHCSAFIATGEATNDGRIVMAHSTIFPKGYIPQRANIILDVKPTDGHRFIMASFPGYIWSSEDFYENENGILLMETTLVPQGPWNERGLPVGVRARKAIQYSNNIDDVIDTLVTRNNGLYPNDWVMGDTKTGEIASLELAFFNHGITRTKNGFLWSCNNAKTDKVRWELASIYGLGIIGRIFVRNFKPNPRDIKFQELGEKHYGKIDIEIAKEIMTTDPISKGTTDCKITDTKLVENLGFWAYLGNPTGKTWIPTPFLEEQLKGVKEFPASGWVKIYGTKSNIKNNQLSFSKFGSNGIPAKVLWIYETEDSRNTAYHSTTISENQIFSSSSTGEIHTLNTEGIFKVWSNKFEEKIFKPVVGKNSVFISSKNWLYCIDKDTGNIKWKTQQKNIITKPSVTNNMVIISLSNGEISAFETKTGKSKWNYKFPASTIISREKNNFIYIGSGKTCYAFDLNQKKTTWSFETDGIITACPEIKDNTVFLGSWDGKIYALNAKTGNLKWSYQTGWGIDTQPEVSDGLVFTGSNDNNFYALDENNGVLKWFFSCKSAIHSSPKVYGDYVFFGCDDGHLYALNKKNGACAWSFTPGHSIKTDNADNYITTPILSDPDIHNGIVYISAKGNIYALDAQTIETEPIPIVKKSDIIQDIQIVILIIFIIISTIYILSKRKKQLKK